MQYDGDKILQLNLYSPYFLPLHPCEQKKKFLFLNYNLYIHIYNQKVPKGELYIVINLFS